MQFKLEDLGGDPKALKAKMDEAIADLASARAQAAKLEKDGPSFGRPEDGTAVAPDQAIAEFNQKVEESDAKIAKLENTINAYAAAIRVADAETKRTGQIIANDLAEQAAATSQAEISAGQRRKEAVLALEREKWNAIKGLVKTTAEENERIKRVLKTAPIRSKGRHSKPDCDWPNRTTILPKQSQLIVSYKSWPRTTRPP